MKKLLILLPIIALTACDRPKHTLDLTCELDLEWQNNFPIHLNTKPSGEYDITFTNVKINLQLFDNYAKLTLDDITTTLEKVKEKTYGNIKDTSYKGNFPGSQRTAFFTISQNISSNKMFDYNIEFVGTQIIEEHGDNVALSFFCEPVTNKDSDNQ